MKVYVSYGRTVSKNYQSKKAEFGFFIDNVKKTDVAAGFQLCEFVVNKRLEERVGSSRKVADALAKRFFNCSFADLTAEGEEQL